MEIIVRGSRSKSGKISKENKAEWHNERRAKMLSQKGYRPENIEAMMFSPKNNIRGQQIRKWLKSNVNPKEMKYNKHI